MFPTFRADLHCHSTCSDGTLTPEELVLLAKSLNLQGLSITDHDNISAYLLAAPLAKEQGLLLGSGLELSAQHKKQEVHILGYDYDPHSEHLIQFCELQIQQRTKRNKLILDQLSKLKMPIPYEKLELLASQGMTIGRPHIAQLLKEEGYVETIKEAFDRFLGNGKIGYVARHGFAVEECIECIHKAKGKAFIAHPYFLEPSILTELLKMPFDGIECYYGNSYPYQAKPWLDIAHKKNWLICGGSDFHGKLKANLNLGASWVDEEAYKKIFCE